MKTKSFIRITCMLLLMIITAGHAKAQQVQNVKSQNAAGYIFHVFQAPNKIYGYDILKDGKIQYHQFASIIHPNEINIVLSKKEQAEQAALLSIEKIKRGQAPELTQEEIKRIINNPSLKNQ